VSQPDPAGLPRLGPRTWWVYLALAAPKTAAQLSAEAGIVETSVRKHLRRLERAELVARSQEPGAETHWTRIRELDQGTVYGLVGRVERARLKQPRDGVLAEYPRLLPTRLWVAIAAAVVVCVAVVVALLLASD
jgi:hypothetical protein